MAKTLYHRCTGANGDPQDGVFVDGNGFKYVIPYDEPTDIESSFMADRIIEHLHYFGIVEVFSTKDRSGVHYDVKDAIDRATKSLALSEKQCIDDYVRTQLEDRVRANFPPLPPQGRALDCVIKHKVNLQKLGLSPVGWQPPYPVEVVPGTVPLGSANPETEARIRQLEQSNMQLQGMIMELLHSKRTEDKADKVDKDTAAKDKAKKTAVPDGEIRQSVNL